jgi:hypothetical protein
VLANVRIKLPGAVRELELLARRRANMVVLLMWGNPGSRLRCWKLELELGEGRLYCFCELNQGFGTAQRRNDGIVIIVIGRKQWIVIAEQRESRSRGTNGSTRREQGERRQQGGDWLGV